MSQLSTRLDAVRARRALLAAQRAEQQQLARELATYTSAADHLEMDGVLKRHTPEDAASVRDLLRTSA